MIVRLFTFLESLLETADSLTESFHELGNLLASEKQEDHKDDDENFPPAEHCQRKD